jgi:methylglutaconyl-CoA hydratase
MNDVLQTRQEGRVLRLWLNRPAKRNALTAELCHDLVHTLDRASQDNTVGAILLAGRGESFCAGMDLEELAESDVDAISSAQELLFTVNARLTKPLVGAVHGAAVAGGTGLVANCHLVVATENATFGLTDINLAFLKQRESCVER